MGISLSCNLMITNHYAINNTFKSEQENKEEETTKWKPL